MYMVLGARASSLAAVFAIGAFAVGCSRASGEDGEGEQGAGEQLNVRVVNVAVDRVAPGEFTGFIRVTGEVEAINDATVSAEEVGRVREILASRGDWVEQGAPLLKIEDDLLLAQVQEARIWRDRERVVLEPEVAAIQAQQVKRLCCLPKTN